jgi:hypothetical protein
MYKGNAAKNHQNTRDWAGRIATGNGRRMSAAHVDFAVLGATPQARLVAGLLASVHGKSVLYQGESQSGYRLPRSIDLSVAPLTRPETWSLLQSSWPETRKVLVRIGGRSAISLIDPIFYADGEAAQNAVGHIRHMAQAFKFPAERVPGKLLGPDRQGVLFRDALFLHRASLEPALDKWLGSVGVKRLPMDAPLVMKPDGSAVVLVDDGGYEIGQTILADDAAIIAHLPAEQWPNLLRTDTGSTLLTEPTKPIATPLMHQLDSGIALTQHARAGIAALGPGSIEQVGETTRMLLGSERGMRQAGQTSYQLVRTRDGAPALGRIGGTGPDILAHFGETAAFFAPAIARWLAGVATADENTWFAARLVNRDPAGSAVSEWGGAL